MSVRVSFFSRLFKFNFKARTSRGLMKDKLSWFLRAEEEGQPGSFGLGECGPLPGLSMDDKPDFEHTLAGIAQAVNESGLSSRDLQKIVDLVPPEYPSIVFGLETALLDLRNGGKRVIYENSFVNGKPIPINGLIWMGDMDFMMDQINTKVSQGFRCLKLKVGGLDFERECDILSYIRRRYFRESITIRLDANGAFKTDDVLYKLTEMARFDIHSIEQPIKPGLAEMEELCRKSPIPVAFDEEMIGIMRADEKEALLRTTLPGFIVLKPTLHGGMRGCDEWISIAGKLGIGWWMTSALESSIGLNAICQFTANYDPVIHQGLGTGAIYQDNIASPLVLFDGMIFGDPFRNWDV